MNNKTSISILFFLCALMVAAQDPCDTYLDFTSKIQNDYRSSAVSDLNNLYNNDFEEGSFYTGNGIRTWFNYGFTRGIWVGGYDPAMNLKLSISGYNNNGVDFASGPILPGNDVDEEVCTFFNRVWEVTAEDIDLLRTAFSNGTLILDSIPADVLEWPALGNPHIDRFAPEYDMAPFHDSNADGYYDPILGDYPIPLSENSEFIPHEFRFYVFNDNAPHEESQGEPLLIEFHVIDYVIDCATKSESETAVFSRLKYLSRAPEDIKDFKLAIWEDMDLGCANDDYVGHSKELNCTYAYNNSGREENCSAIAFPVPDTVGVISSLIIVDQELKGACYFNNVNISSVLPATTEPNSTEEYFNYLSGFWKDGTPFTKSGNGYNTGSTDTTRFLFPDLPNNPNGWSMQSENLDNYDRRTLTTLLDTVLYPGSIGTIDYIDYVLANEDYIGLDIFDIFEEKVRGVKADYEAMKTGDFVCPKPSKTENLIVVTNPFHLYPNPVNQDLNIKFEELNQGSITIYTAEGKQVKKIEIDSNFDYRVSMINYPSGFYYVVFENYKGEISNSYFVKE